MTVAIDSLGYSCFSSVVTLGVPIEPTCIHAKFVDQCVQHTAIGNVTRIRLIVGNHTSVIRSLLVAILITISSVVTAFEHLPTSLSLHYSFLHFNSDTVFFSSSSLPSHLKV